VAENIELTIRFHPVGGDDVSLLSADFAGPQEALEAVARALDERRSLVLAHVKESREASESGMVINLANVVSVRVSKIDRDTTGPYL
jgi:flavin-binding protein dodecin